ncbi:MAG: hypothetical protein AAB474_02145 [Patescibacteria group bacterium]
MTGNKILKIGGIIVLILIALIFLWPYLTKREISYADFEKHNIKSEMTQEQIDDFISLKPGKSFYGKVLDKEKDNFTLEVYLQNIVNPADSKYVSLKIPVAKTDEFKRVGRSFATKSLEALKVSFSDMKKDDLAGVSVYESKKIIILPL